MDSDKIIIRAGGGLVVDQQGRFLMIFRRGHWDLPKGKLDDGETIEQCALREVAEECGLNNLQLGHHLCTTTHHYCLDGQQIEKPTTWFLMHTTKSEPLIPQTEEDIELCQWVAPDEVAEKLEQSYPTIATVFAELGVMN